MDAVNRVNAVGEARDAGGHEVLIAEVTDAWAGAGLAKAIHLVVGPLTVSPSALACGLLPQSSVVPTTAAGAVAERAGDSGTTACRAAQPGNAGPVVSEPEGENGEVETGHVARCADMNMPDEQEREAECNPGCAYPLHVMTRRSHSAATSAMRRRNRSAWLGRDSSHNKAIPIAGAAGTRDRYVGEPARVSRRVAQLLDRVASRGTWKLIGRARGFAKPPNFCLTSDGIPGTAVLFPTHYLPPAPSHPAADRGHCVLANLNEREV